MKKQKNNKILVNFAGTSRISAAVLTMFLFLNNCVKNDDSNFLNDPANHPVETFGILMALSMGYIDFTTERNINATEAKVFSIISDYERYPFYFPDLHDITTIISQTKTGKGVIWRNNGSFNGQSFVSTWEVIEFIQDKKVVMKDTEGEGTVALTISPVAPGVVKYNYQAHILMFLPMKNEFLTILEKEANSVKYYSELP
ncbi:MAG: hypothetical protein OEZ34_02335 [Spirochaetia bacterium]|nr:hypothetical protein [Spirochaetia bacterium]